MAGERQTARCEDQSGRRGFCSRPATIYLCALEAANGGLDIRWPLCTFHARYWAVQRHPDLAIIGDARIVRRIEREREAIRGR